jgi:hypothetical protein
MYAPIVEKKFRGTNFKLGTKKSPMYALAVDVFKI